MIIVTIAQALTPCPICRGPIRMDDVVTLVIKRDGQRYVAHFGCYARRCKRDRRQQQQRRRALPARS